MNVEVNDHSFKEEITNCATPVIVNFWAPWCEACYMITPIWEEIAVEYRNIIKIVKINTDENPTVATEYNIRTIPTAIIFSKGKLVDKIIGAVPKSTIVLKFKNLLKIN